LLRQQQTEIEYWKSAFERAMEIKKWASILLLTKEWGLLSGLQVLMNYWSLC
jgi:hypothetical protein